MPDHGSAPDHLTYLASPYTHKGTAAREVVLSRVAVGGSDAVEWEDRPYFSRATISGFRACVTVNPIRERVTASLWLVGFKRASRVYPPPGKPDLEYRNLDLAKTDCESRLRLLAAATMEGRRDGRV
ncbi:MAG: hypothetical protein WC789_14480 [Lentisphaeria bacterium]